MARIIRTRMRARGRRSWWPSVIAGGAVGAVAAWTMLRVWRRDAGEEAAEPVRSRGEPREPDLDAMAARLRRVPGAQELRLRSLGGGILELVGSAAPGLDVPALLYALGAEPNVSVVVNRCWTPDEADAQPQPLPSPESGDSASSAPSAP